jgi:hypothetical protein
MADSCQKGWGFGSPIPPLVRAVESTRSPRWRSLAELRNSSRSCRWRSESSSARTGRCLARCIPESTSEERLNCIEGWSWSRSGAMGSQHRPNSVGCRASARQRSSGNRRRDHTQHRLSRCCTRRSQDSERRRSRCSCCPRSGSSRAPRRSADGRRSRIHNRCRWSTRCTWTSTRRNHQRRTRRSRTRYRCRRRSADDRRRSRPNTSCRFRFRYMCHHHTSGPCRVRTSSSRFHRRCTSVRPCRRPSRRHTPASR